MQRLPWTGLASLPWTKRPAHGPRAAEGLVLAGGGARASFQIGALRYLYDHAGIHPTVMVGTSAGSILAAALAQYADREGQSATVRALEEVWLSMRISDQMFAPRPWFRRLQERSSDWVELMSLETELPAPRRSLPRLTLLPRAEPEAGDSPDERAVEVEELTGQARTLELAMNDPSPTGPGFSPALVLPLLSMLPRLRTTGGDLSMILRGADASRSMYHPGSLLVRLLDEEFFQSGAVALSGITVRLAVVALESGELRFMTETGHLVDRDNTPLDEPVQDLSLGVLASCSIPAVFAPVQMGEEWYVDGGVRESTPAEMAIGQLGVGRCYVVVSNPIEQPQEPSFKSRSMLDVMMRASQIMSDETERDEVAYAHNAGALVIEPELFVHDAITVDPGLIQINRDYGWLRALEAHQDLPAPTVAAHRRIIERRLQALDMERTLLQGQTQATRDEEKLLLALARVKFQIRDDLAPLDPFQLPPSAPRWWMDWEHHLEAVDRAPVWMSPS